MTNNNNQYKIIFMGTPEIACPSLESLAKHPNFKISAVITQPDRPFGRGQKLTPPPIKILAQKINLQVLQPETLKNNTELLNQFKKINPDFIIVIAYGKILPESILNLPNIDCINIHGSILPKYRGASPIEQSLLNSDETTGISIMKMEKTMDTGPIYSTHQINILPTDNAETLRKKLGELSAKILPETLIKISTNQLKAIPQNHHKATYCTKFTKSDGLINFENSDFKTINAKLKAFYIWPNCYFNYQNQLIKIHEISPSTENLKPNQFLLTKKFLHVGTKSTSIAISKLQFAGKKIQSVETIYEYLKKLFPH